MPLALPLPVLQATGDLRHATQCSVFTGGGFPDISLTTDLSSCRFRDHIDSVAGGNSWFSVAEYHLNQYLLYPGSSAYRRQGFHIQAAGEIMHFNDDNEV